MEIEYDEVEHKVRELFAVIEAEGDPGKKRYHDAQEELFKEAFQAGNLKLFLRVLGEQKDEIRAHFYRLLCLRRRNSASVMRAFEKHLRWAFDVDRKGTRAIIERMEDRDTVSAMFRIVSLTNVGVVARELLRIIRKHKAQDLRSSIIYGLKSGDERLQWVALHVARRVEDEHLIRPLLRYYLQQEKEGGIRLRLQARRALLESLDPGATDLVIKWLQSRNANVRGVGIRAAQHLSERKFIPDLVRLVLLDARTRAGAAMALLQFEQRGLLSFLPDDDRSQQVREIIGRAKMKPLTDILKRLLSDDNGVLREIGIKFIFVLEEKRHLIGKVQRLAETDTVAAVRVSALRLLGYVDIEAVKPILVDILSDPARNAKNSYVLDTAESILKAILTEDELEAMREKIAERRREREEALSRFEADFESWREQL